MSGWDQRYDLDDLDDLDGSCVPVILAAVPIGAALWAVLAWLVLR